MVSIQKPQVSPESTVKQGFSGLAAELASVTSVKRGSSRYFTVDGGRFPQKAESYTAFVAFKPKLDQFVVIKSPDDKSIPGAVFTVNRSGEVTSFDDNFLRPNDYEVTMVDGATPFQFQQSPEDPKKEAVARAVKIVKEIEEFGVGKRASFSVRITTDDSTRTNRPQR